MRIAGLWLILVPFVLALVYILQDVIGTWHQFGAFSFNIGMLELLVLPIPGALLCLASWIVNGLAEPTK
jgi:TRAP-type mannitol/chloroaromatic compound transport system permease small subunit